MFKQSRLISTIVALSILTGVMMHVFAETIVDTEIAEFAPTEVTEHPHPTEQTDEQTEQTHYESTNTANQEQEIINEKESIYETNKIINENIGDTQSDANIERSSVNTTSSIPNDFSIEPVSTPAFEYSNSNEAVSMTTGALNFEKTLLSLPGRNGMDLDITIRYNSQAAIKKGIELPTSYTLNSNEIAPGWTFSFPTITKTTYSYNNNVDRNYVLADGSAYKILNDTEETDPYTYLELQSYLLDDMRLWRTPQNDYISAYIDLYHDTFDGTYGNLKQRSDPYGNVITFEYETVNDKRRLKKITDSVGRIVDIEYVGNDILIKVGTETYATIDLDTLWTEFDDALIVTSIIDAEGLETSFEYEEVVPQSAYESYYAPQDCYSNILMTKITYPTGGAYNYEYTKTRRSYSHIPLESSSETPINSWYEVYKVSKRYNSYAEETLYSYEGDYSGYPYSYLRTDEYPNPTGYIEDSTVQYQTTMDYEGACITQTFNYRHNKIKEQSHRTSYSGTIHQTDYVYNNYNQPITVTKSVIDGELQKTLTTEHYEYMPGHNAIIETTDALGNVTEYSYDTLSPLIPLEVVYYAGTENEIVITNEMDSGPVCPEMTITEYGDRTVKTYYTYDTLYSGNVVEEETYEIKNDQTRLISDKIYEYDNNGLFVTKETYLTMETLRYYYDMFHTDEPYFTYTYDNMGNLTSETDMEGYTTTYTYDKNRRPIRTTYPDGTYVENTYNVNSCYEIETSYNGEYTTIDYYDDWGRYLGKSDIDENNVEKIISDYYHYSPYDISISDGNGNYADYRLDSRMRTISVMYDGSYDNALLNVTISYDDYDLTQEINYGGKTKKMFYDNFGRLIREEQNSDAGLNFVTYEYDNRNNLIKATDANGNFVTNTYDVENRLICTTNQLGQQTLYEYDRWGNVSKVTYPGGNVVNYTYDTAGNLIIATDVLGNSEYWRYDWNGNMLGHMDKNGNETTNTYNNMNRLTNTQVGTLSTSYTYGTLGEVLTMTDSTGTTAYSYTYNNRLASITAPDNKSISYTYDNAGNVISVNDYGNNIINYTYDGMNRLDTVKQGTTTLADYEYTPFNTVASIDYGSKHPIFTYDDSLRVMSITSELTGDSIFYEYDVTGNQVAMDYYNLSYSYPVEYEYDDMNRLVREEGIDGTVTTYTFNAGNNIASKSITHPSGYEFKYTDNGVEKALTNVTAHTVTYTYNLANQLLSETESVTGTVDGNCETVSYTKQYTYDANGNTLKAEIIGQINPSVVEYTYNSLNQLTAFEANDGSVTTYGYDGTGMRVSKTQGDVTRKYYWDRGYVANEGIGTNIVATNYIDAQGIFARKNGTEINLFNKDAHGNVVGDSNVYRYDYNAYGNLIAQWTDGSEEITQSYNDENPFLYCGEYFDEESGLIYLRNRYYDSSTGRFVNEDPIKDGTNWYAYCANNPVMFVDPWGLRKGIIVVGTETNLGSVFMDDAITFMNDNKEDEFVVFDARDYIYEEQPMDTLWQDVSHQSNVFGGIDVFVFFGHSQPDMLYVFWDIRTDELSKKERCITYDTNWNYINFNSGANIKFAGCNTAGSGGEKQTNTIAQDVADKTGMTVWGYVWNSYQKKIGNGYYQVPDVRDGKNKGYVRVDTDRVRKQMKIWGIEFRYWYTVEE